MTASIVPAGASLSRARAWLRQVLCAARGAGNYYDARRTIAAARRAGLSVPDYVESLSNARGDTVRVLELLEGAGALGAHREICEIGAGAGRYLAHLLARCRPKTYHVFEIDPAWARHLTREYGAAVRVHPVDGETLATLDEASTGLACAFGVFIYIAPLRSFSYLREMTRVVGPGGFIAFDCYDAGSATLDDIYGRWLPSEHRFAQFLPEACVRECLEQAGFRIVARHRLEFVWSRPTLWIAQRHG